MFYVSNQEIIPCIIGILTFGKNNPIRNTFEVNALHTKRGRELFWLFLDKFITIIAIIIAIKVATRVKL